MRAGISIRSSNGFTLVEALISLVVLAFAAVVLSTLYSSGLQALDAQADRAVVDSFLRSRMELLISEKFDQLAGGTEIVTVGGQDYTIDWTVANVDLDGDAVAEPTAKLITVSVDNRSLNTIVVDHGGSVGKI